MEPRKSILKNYELISSNGIPCNLGFGAYGSVQLGKCLKTGETVAIKKINRKIATGEVEVHMKLNHPNIIKMLDYAFDEKTETTYIVLEYAENGTLFDYVREHGMKDKQMVRGIFNSVCDAIEFMHSMNVMHRDIKPENILLDRKNCVKVCDFGFAVDCQPRMTLCGTVEYMAPEMIMRKPYNHKIDIWGLGILLFELIEGKAPFEGSTQDEVFSKMKKPIFFSSNFSKDEIELIHRILKVDPKERPQIRDIVKSSCLRGSNRGSDQMKSIRSTADEQKQKTPFKGIKILEIKEISPQQSKSCQIQIVSIKEIPKNQKNAASLISAPSKVEKISLRRAMTRKS